MAGSNACDPLLVVPLIQQIQTLQNGTSVYNAYYNNEITKKALKDKIAKITQDLNSESNPEKSRAIQKIIIKAKEISKQGYIEQLKEQKTFWAKARLYYHQTINWLRSLFKKAEQEKDALALDQKTWIKFQVKGAFAEGVESWVQILEISPVAMKFKYIENEVVDTILIDKITPNSIVQFESEASVVKARLEFVRDKKTYIKIKNTESGENIFGYVTEAGPDEVVLYQAYKGQEKEREVRVPYVKLSMDSYKEYARENQCLQAYLSDRFANKSLQNIWVSLSANGRIVKGRVLDVTEEDTVAIGTHMLGQSTVDAFVSLNAINGPYMEYSNYNEFIDAQIKLLLNGKNINYVRLQYTDGENIKRTYGTLLGTGSDSKVVIKTDARLMGKEEDQQIVLNHIDWKEFQILHDEESFFRDYLYNLKPDLADTMVSFSYKKHPNPVEIKVAGKFAELECIGDYCKILIYVNGDQQSEPMKVPLREIELNTFQVHQNNLDYLKSLVLANEGKYVQFTVRGADSEESEQKQEKTYFGEYTVELDSNGAPVAVNMKHLNLRVEETKIEINKIDTNSFRSFQLKSQCFLASIHALKLGQYVSFQYVKAGTVLGPVLEFTTGVVQQNKDGKLSLKVFLPTDGDTQEKSEIEIARITKNSSPSFDEYATERRAFEDGVNYKLWLNYPNSKSVPVKFKLKSDVNTDVFGFISRGPENGRVLINIESADGSTQRVDLNDVILTSVTVSRHALGYNGRAIDAFKK